MMRFLLAGCLFFFSIHISAQQNWNIPLSLYAKTANLPPWQMIGILVEGNPVAVANAAKKCGGYFSYKAGSICSVHIPAGKLLDFSHEPGIIRIGNAPVDLRPLNDTMKIQTRILDVHNGVSPLTQSYKGENVIMGMIDSGIDFNHPDFKDSLGNTRIMYIWDQRDNSGPGPSPWNYGTLWDSAQINAGQCLHNDLQYWGHGTHVSGIAAGNGLSTNAANYAGGAPKSDIIMVALDFNGANSPVAVADAAAFIYAQAQAMGRPCVINASVGDYYGSHDAQDLQAMMIDTLLNTPNRIFVCASGNAGDLPIHLSYSLSPDTNFTWFASGGPPMYLQLWADTNNFNAARMAIGCTQSGNWADRGRTAFTSIQSNLSVNATDTIFNANGQRMAIVERFGSVQGNAYSMEYLVTPDSASGYEYSLQLTGGGLFHLWSFDIETNPLPSAGAYPKIVYYKQTDTTHTVCSSFQCSNRTITVGNYINRRTWMNVNNQLYTDPSAIAGEIMFNSSVGPTRDGRVKPEIAAPGANDISCGEISSLPAIISSAPDAVGVGGFHVAGGGTSAASPVVAGSAALWLQAYPGSDWQDARNAVIWCAHQDGFTGNQLPDNTWGYGKIDAFSMIVNCSPLSTHMPQAAGTEMLNVFPNPATAAQTISVTFPQADAGSLMRVYNSTGQLVLSRPVAAGISSIELDANGWAAGVYQLVFVDGNKVLGGRIVVE